MCVGVSLGFLSYSFDLYFCFLSVPYRLDYCSFVVWSEVRQVDSSSFVLLSQVCFGYLRFFCISIHCREMPTSFHSSPGLSHFGSCIFLQQRVQFISVCFAKGYSTKLLSTTEHVSRHAPCSWGAGWLTVLCFILSLRSKYIPLRARLYFITKEETSRSRMWK